MKSLTPNTLLQNRYLLVQLIGKGGMGEVYLAVDQRLGSAVALKRTFFTDDETLGGAFEREARTLARLRHPVLPKVSDHFSEDGNQYLVMDHISGDDLSKRLETAKKPFPLNWVLFWADQLLDALNYLHSYNPPIVHRDIKPQNLKLTDDNHIVLLDFGLAKDNVGNTRVTSSGSVVGFTPHYAPMEQIRGIGTDPKSDLYSLSATLYQLLTNTVPPDALSRADVLLGQMPDPLIPVNELNPEVSKTISNVIAKGMSISLDQRLSSAREMQKLLRDGYAQMQNAMSAQTVAFNLKDHNKEAEEIEQPEIAPPIEEKLDQFATIINKTPISPLIVSTHNSTSIGDKTEQMNFAEIAGENLDSSPPENLSDYDSQPKQSNVNTEVFLAGSGILPVVESETESEKYSENSSVENVVSFTSYVNEDENFPSEAPTSFDSVQISGKSEQEVFDFSDSQDFSNVGENFNISNDQVGGSGFTEQNLEIDRNDYAEESQGFNSKIPPPVKKSGRNGMFIAGGLFLLLFLVVGAAGMGWYFYNNSREVVEDPISQPTPEATPSALPTPEPTADIANSDNNSNSDVLTTDANSIDSANSQTINSTVVTDSNIPKATPTPSRATPTPSRATPTPSRATPTPSRATPTPSRATPTPKPQGGKDVPIP